MKKIVIITDVWRNTSLNGVVTMLMNTKKVLEKKGFKVSMIHTGQFRTIPLPTYKEIKLAIMAKWKMERMLRRAKPDYIHIATEGPLGLTARSVCLKNKWKFTTFYHTRLPEYVYVRLGAFRRITYAYLRWFHKKSACTMVSTMTLKKELEKKRFGNIAVVPLGVDIALFKRNSKVALPVGLQKPIFAFLGRLAPEKNIEAFLKCKLPGSKLIIGDGPSRKELEEKYRDGATFVGYKRGKELVDLLSAADVFVFPSKTDTLSLVIMEAMACGLPVAAYNVQGPINIITPGEDGFLGANLAENAKKCLKLDRKNCLKKAKLYSWENTGKIFLKNLAGI